MSYKIIAIYIVNKILEQNVGLKVLTLTFKKYLL